MCEACYGVEIFGKMDFSSVKKAGESAEEDGKFLGGVGS